MEALTPLRASHGVIFFKNHYSLRGWGAKVSPTLPFLGGRVEAPLSGIMKRGESLFPILLPHCAPHFGLIPEHLLSIYYVTALSAGGQQSVAVLGGETDVNKINK